MKKFTCFALSVLLSLSFCIPAAAAEDYGVIYDETEQLGSESLQHAGEVTLPALTEQYGVDLRVDILTKSDYDTVLIGYPIWWGIAAWPVDTFVKANDFNGKTVIPFCTSASSGLGQSGKLLEREANGGDWKNGQRFNERPSDSTIKNWTDSIK